MSTQGERIVKLEANYKTMFDQNNKDHKEIKKAMESGFEQLEEKLDDFIKSAEKKFAPIWVKSVLVWTGSIVGSFLILFALKEIFTK